MKLKMHNSITATDFVRNVSSVIDRVRVSGKRLDIMRGLQTVATISPPVKAGFPIEQLKILFHELPHIGKENALHMAADLKIIRTVAVLPDNLWD
jgi:hypothetical protein